MVTATPIGAILKELLPTLPIPTTLPSAQPGLEPNSRQNLEAQLTRYRLKSLTESESAEVTSTEAARKRCENCQGLSKCQFSGARVGFTPTIRVVADFGERQLRFGVEECRFRESWKAERRARRLLGESGIPACYRDLTFRDYPLKTEADLQAVEAARTLGPLYLWGLGRGKTMLASIIGNELIRRGESVLFRAAGELMVSLRPNEEGYADRLEAIKEAPTLILDDLGLEQASERNGERLQMIIDSRVRERRRLIITSRLSAEGAGARYHWGEVGARLSERLRRLPNVHVG